LEHRIQAGIDRRRLFELAGIGALSLAAPLPLHALPRRKYSALQAKVAEYIDQKKAAGIVLAIGQNDEEPDIVKKGRLAFDSTVPVNKNSLFRIYSMTKPITGMAAMILHQEGKITLDQPIADFLPEFGEMRVLTSPDSSLESIPTKRQITLRHLLTHTAGLGYTFIDKGPIKKIYEERGITPLQITRRPIPGWNLEHTAGSLSEFSKELAKLPLIYTPGTTWNYSVSLDLLGHLIAVISGMPFEDFLQQRIFNPLKMTSTYFQVPEKEICRLTTNYSVHNGRLQPLDPAQSSVFLDKPRLIAGGAGLISSAHDYDRFLHMLMNLGTLDGAQILSEETASQAMSNLLPKGTDTTRMWMKFSGFGAGGVLGRDGVANTFGWGGAAGTNSFVSAKHRYRATAMIQYFTSRQQDFQAAFPQLVAADLIEQGVLK